MSLEERLRQLPDSDYDAVCKHAYRRIYQELSRKDNRQLRFVSQSAIDKCLTDQTLQEFFKSLGTATTRAEDLFGIKNQTFLDIVKERRLRNFVACFIFAGCFVNAARSFTARLIATEQPLTDTHGNLVGRLPATNEQLTLVFDDLVARDKFAGLQACFSPVILQKGQEVQVQTLLNERLPYELETPIAEGSGSYGKVTKVTIARGHFEGMDLKVDVDVDDVVVARKDYYMKPPTEDDPGGPEGDYRKEHEVMLKILRSKWSNSHKGRENILETFGTVHVISENIYSLFMPLALCDLRAYLYENHYYRPITTKARVKIVKSAQGLASGLNFLHTEMRDENDTKFVAYHMDLKPANILLFAGEANDETYVWKISDFGMSSVKEVSNSNNNNEEQDEIQSNQLRNWLKFRPNRIQNHSVATPTENKRFDGTYLAPESMEERNMTTRSDVWSLGCIISVVFAFLDSGKIGVLEYIDARMADGVDCFFLYNTKAQKAREHPEVKKTHDWLIRQAKERGPYEANATSYMLRYLEDKVLKVDKNARADAKGVEDALEETWKELEKTWRQPEESAGLTNIGQFSTR
jgi:serine/threonine protein kinase